MKPDRYATTWAILRATFPDLITEHKFHPVRKWRFDAAIPSARIAIEINGAVWTGGRHSRGSGLMGEYEKMRAAAILGWRVMPFSTQELAQIPAAVWEAARPRSEDPTNRIQRRPRALERKP